MNGRCPKIHTRRELRVRPKRPDLPCELRDPRSCFGRESRELRPRSLLQDIADHLRLKFPRGEAARHYNPLQKLTYLGVIFVLLPLMIVTGLAMSPGMDAILPWLVDLFGGRQSARMIHFIAASLIVLFVFVHVAMVFLSGEVVVLPW